MLWTIVAECLRGQAEKGGNDTMPGEEKPFIENDLTEEDLRPTEEEARLLDELSKWEERSKESLDNYVLGEPFAIRLQ